MNKKQLGVIIAVCTVLLATITACGSKQDEAKNMPQEIPSPAGAAANENNSQTAMQNGVDTQSGGITMNHVSDSRNVSGAKNAMSEEGSLLYVAQLLDQNDDTVGGLYTTSTMDRGEQGNIVGRSLQVQLFGEKLDANLVYDDNGRTNLILVNMPDHDADYYIGKIKTVLNISPENRTIDDEESEYYVWDTEGAQISLFNAYGAVSLEISRK